ncbi:MAG: DUF4364 family protein [Oscillospiraceae bacterium]|jgi:hypothetical protein|nr:DUF4364 family protein [Oscillospiraceae bacterium]
MTHKRQIPGYVYEHLGFVHSEYDIKCLLLFALEHCGRWIHLSSLTEIALGADGGFTYFDMVEALTSLVKLGLAENREDCGQFYRVTDKGTELNDITRRDVEFTVRRAVRKISARRYFEDILLKHNLPPKELEQR